MVPSAGEDRTVDRQATKQGEKYRKNEVMPRAQEDRLERLENKEKSAGKMNGSQAQERTELLFNGRENTLPAPNVKYSIPVCKEIKARGKWTGFKDDKHVAGTKR